MWTLSCIMWDLVPWQGTEPGPPYWKLRILATGPVGNPPWPLFVETFPINHCHPNHHLRVWRWGTQPKTVSLSFSASQGPFPPILTLPIAPPLSAFPSRTTPSGTSTTNLEADGIIWARELPPQWLMVLDWAVSIFSILSLLSAVLQDGGSSALLFGHQRMAMSVGFQLETILSPEGHLAVYGGISSCHNWHPVGRGWG